MTLPERRPSRAWRRALDVAILGSAMLATSILQARPPAELVQFESLDHVAGRPLTIEALLFRPANANPANALLGWSHGGSTTLATIDAGDRDVVSFRNAGAATPFFRAAIAFYPGCRSPLRDARWRPAFLREAFSR